MDTKHSIWLFGGAASMAAVGAALIAVSGTAHGLHDPTIDTTLALPAQQSEYRILLAQADVAPVQSPVSYSSDQAERGKRQYERDCADCHGDDLDGGINGGALLKGLSFEEKYANGAPAGVLFEVMSATMPPNAPGRFSASTYADLMAYLLKRNGFQEGAPLPSDVDALYSLTMEK